MTFIHFVFWSFLLLLLLCNTLPMVRAEWRPTGNWIILLVLFLCLGWHCFGAPIK